MKQKIVFYNDPTQLNIWSHVKEKLYTSFDLITRENITKQDQNVIALGSIIQSTKILPCSILNKKYKTVLGKQNKIDLEILKQEIEQNELLGFHVTPKTLGIHPSLVSKEYADYFKPYVDAYHTIDETKSAIDAVICSETSADFMASKIQKVRADAQYNVMVLPFFTMSASGKFNLTCFDDLLDHDFVLDKIQKYGFSDFNNLNKMPSFGWFDCVRARYLIKEYGCDGLILTFPDFLPHHSLIKLCSSYMCGNDVIQDLDSRTNLEEMTPFYETYEGWEKDCSELSQLYDFPSAFFKLIKRIEQLVDCPVISLITANPIDARIDLSFPTLFRS